MPDGHPARARRVVSLVPSATETLLGWGVRPVAVTRFCEQPDLPAVGGTKDPDLDAIAALGPDVVVMCREENRVADAEALRAAGLRVHDIAPGAVDEVGPALEALAASVGLPGPVDGPAPPEVKPLGVAAFIPIWRRPWMTMAGATYGSSVLAAIGVTNVFGDLPVTGDADRYPPVDLADAADRLPEVVLAPSEPYPFGARHLPELEEVAPTVLVDGKDLFWWGIRTAGAVARLHASLNRLRPVVQRRSS